MTEKLWPALLVVKTSNKISYFAISWEIIAFSASAEINLCHYSVEVPAKFCISTLYLGLAFTEVNRQLRYEPSGSIWSPSSLIHKLSCEKIAKSLSSKYPFHFISFCNWGFRKRSLRIKVANNRSQWQKPKIFISLSIRMCTVLFFHVSDFFFLF